MTTHASSRIPSGSIIRSGNPRCANPSFSLGPSRNLKVALEINTNPIRIDITLPVQISFLLATGVLPNVLVIKQNSYHQPMVHKSPAPANHSCASKRLAAPDDARDA